MNVGNYKAINIINIIAKVNDMILCSRLNTWFKAFREQAGSRKGGCLEHIVSLFVI